MELTEYDFTQLYENSTNWSSYAESWRAQDGRFEPMPDYNRFARAYWFCNYADLLLGRLFLTSHGFESSTHYDGAEDAESHVLLTDFGGAL